MHFTASDAQLVYSPTDSAQLVGATTLVFKVNARLVVRNTNQRPQPPNLGINLTDAFILFVRRQRGVDGTTMTLRGSAILRGI